MFMDFSLVVFFQITGACVCGPCGLGFMMSRVGFGHSGYWSV